MRLDFDELKYLDGKFELKDEEGSTNIESIKNLKNVILVNENGAGADKILLHVILFVLIFIFPLVLLYWAYFLINYFMTKDKRNIALEFSTDKKFVKEEGNFYILTFKKDEIHGVFNKLKDIAEEEKVNTTFAELDENSL